MNKKVQFVIWLLVCIAAILLIGVVCYNLVNEEMSGNVHPEITFEIKDYGNVKFELYPEYAPNTVRNIIKLAQTGYYDNKVIYGKDDFSLYIGRDENGEDSNPTIGQISEDIEIDSEEDYKYSIKGEFIANEFEKNTLRHEKGVLTLLRNDYSQIITTLTEQSYNSGCAQLAVMMSDDAKALNGMYAAFGKVVEGMDVIENIYTNVEVASHVETAEDGTETVTNEDSDGIQSFNEYPIIVSAKVDTKGEDFGMPETQEAFDYEGYMQQLMSQYYGAQ